jgi:hypothetical protein
MHDHVSTNGGLDFDLGVPPVEGSTFHRLEQGPGLGRHVLHDEQSRQYDAEAFVRSVARPRTTLHTRRAPIWNQGPIGACTAFAALGLLMTEPFYGDWMFTEGDAVRLYEQETALDDRQIPGRYPEQDTGSTGLWSMKALKAAGYITGYRHAFSVDTVLKLLQLSPVSLGIPWYESMNETHRHDAMVSPDEWLAVDFGSGLAGGHQIVAVGVDYEREAVRLANSWGTSWGEDGYAWLGFRDLTNLLARHGDAVVPVPARGLWQ